MFKKGREFTMTNIDININIKGLMSDLKNSDRIIELKALKTLSRIGSKHPDLIISDIEIIKDKLNSKDSEICSYACWTAGQIGINRPELYSDKIDLLFDLIHHSDFKVRENSLFAIGRIGRAKPSLIEKLIHKIIEKKTDTEPKVRMNMIWASENIANSKPDLFQPYIKDFEDLLKDPDIKNVRREAPEFFRVMGKHAVYFVKNSIPELEKLLTDDDKVVRIHAQGAIKSIRKHYTQ
jgi:HEAT repeat protein